MVTNVYHCRTKRSKCRGRHIHQVDYSLTLFEHIMCRFNIPRTTKRWALMSFFVCVVLPTDAIREWLQQEWLSVSSYLPLYGGGTVRLVMLLATLVLIAFVLSSTWIVVVRYAATPIVWTVSTHSTLCMQYTIHWLHRFGTRHWRVNPPP